MPRRLPGPVGAQGLQSDVSWPRPGVVSDTHSFFQKQVFVFRILFCFQKHIVWFQKFLLGFRNALFFSETHWAISESRGGRFPLGFWYPESISEFYFYFKKFYFGFRNVFSISESMRRFQNPGLLFQTRCRFLFAWGFALPTLGLPCTMCLATR